MNSHFTPAPHVAFDLDRVSPELEYLARLNGAALELAHFLRTRTTPRLLTSLSGHNKEPEMTNHEDDAPTERSEGTLEERYAIYVAQMESLGVTPKSFDEWLNT